MYARVFQRRACICRGRISWIAMSLQRPFAVGDAQPAADLRPGPAGRHRVSLDPARGPGHRALRAGASFAKNPAMFDPENIVKLAIEGGCNAVASTLGVLGACARKYAHKIPFIAQDQSQRVPDLPEQVRSRSSSPASSRPRTWARSAVGATIYFGSEPSPPRRSWR